MDTLKYNGKKNSMLYFPKAGSKESSVIKLISKTSLKEQLYKYCEDNGIKDAEFVYEVGTIRTNTMVTIWCHHHLYDGLTNVYLMGVIDYNQWNYYECWPVLSHKLQLEL